MKNLIFICALLAYGITAFAAEKAAPDVWASPKHKKYSTVERWESVQAGFWFGVPGTTEYEDVCGLKIGFPICSGSGNVIGAEMSLFCSATDHVKGLQCSIGNTHSKDFSGLQWSMVNVAGSAYGCQLGMVNVAKKRGFQFGLVNVSQKAPCQFGLLNFNEGGWLPFTVFFNFTP